MTDEELIDWLSRAPTASFDRIVANLGAAQDLSRQTAQSVLAIEVLTWAKATNNRDLLIEEIQKVREHDEIPRKRIVELIFGVLASGLMPLVNLVLFRLNLPDIYEPIMRYFVFTAVIACVSLYLFRIWVHSAVFDRFACIVIGLAVGTLATLVFPFY